MNKEALESIYGDMGFESQGVSFDDFVNTMSTNEEARKSVFNDMGFESQGVSYEQFNETLGFKKKDDTQSDSSLDQEDSESSNQDSSSSLEDRVEEARDDGKFMNIVNNIGNTADNILLSLGITVNEFSGFMERSITGKESPITSIQRVQGSELVDENNKQIEANTIARSYDPEKSFEENVEVAHQGIVDTFEKNGVVAGLGEVGIKALESSPYLIISLLTGGTGGAALTGTTFLATGYGSSIAEQTIENSNPEALSQSRALLHGIVEGTASIAFGGLSKVGKDILKDLGRQEAKKILSNNMKNQLLSMLGDATKTGAAEGLEEAVQEIAHYTIDTFYDDEEFNIERALKIGTDALILGYASGGVVGSGANRYKYARAKAQQSESIGKLDNELELQSTEDNQVKKSMLDKKKSEIINEIEAKDISDEDADQLDKLYYDIQDIEGAIKSTQDADLREEMNKELELKKEESNSIIEKYESGDSDIGSTESKGRSELDVSEESGDAKISEEDGSGIESSDDSTSQEVDDKRDQVEGSVDQDGEADIDTGGKSDIPRIPEQDLKSFSENTKVDFSLIDDSKLKEAGNTKVSTLDVLGVDSGEISVKRAHQLVKKQVKKYEALIKCIG